MAGVTKGPELVFSVTEIPSGKERSHSGRSHRRSHGREKGRHSRHVPNTGVSSTVGAGSGSFPTAPVPVPIPSVPGMAGTAPVFYQNPTAFPVPIPGGTPVPVVHERIIEKERRHSSHRRDYNGRRDDARSGTCEVCGHTRLHRPVSCPLCGSQALRGGASADKSAPFVQQGHLPEGGTVEEPRCESCHERVATLFCVDCELSLCPECDEVVHMAPRLAKHNRIDIDQQWIYRTQCPVHRQQRGSLFCETCDQICCNLCQLEGPHSGSVHTLVPLAEALRNRIDLLRQLAKETGSSSLVERKESIASEIRRIEEKMEEVRKARGEIEAETREVMDAILGRLRQAEAVKLAPLQSDLELLRQQAQNIQGLLRQATKWPSNVSADDRGSWMESYTSLQRAAREAVNRPPVRSGAVDVVRVDDFPREIHDRLEPLKSYAEMSQILQRKDKMLASLLDVVEASQGDRKNMNRRARAATEGWMRLGHSWLEEIKSQERHCCFCGEPMSVASVNTGCPRNSGALAPCITGLVSSAIPPTARGVGRHYFVETHQLSAGELQMLHSRMAPGLSPGLERRPTSYSVRPERRSFGHARPRHNSRVLGHSLPASTTRVVGGQERDFG